MNRHICSTLLLLAPVVAAGQEPHVRVDVRLLPAANLVYQLDCVARVTSGCAVADFLALWKRDFLRTESDSLQLHRWATLRRRYQIGMVLDDTLSEAVTSVDLGDKMRLASLQSHGVADVLARMELLVTPADLRQAREVLRHFEARFLTWWEAEAIPLGTPFAERMSALLAQPHLRAVLTRFVRLYGTPLQSDLEVPMQLVYRPALVRGGSSAQQIERYAVLEFFGNESVRGRIDVAIHELCHFLWGTRTAEQRQSLAHRIHMTRSPATHAALNVMNEGLATALGNGIVARLVSDSTRWQQLLRTPLAFYNNPYVDRSARALLPLMDSVLASGGTIDDRGFAERYVAYIDSALGAAVTAPAILLSELYLFTDTSLGDDVRIEAPRVLQAASIHAEHSPAHEATFREFKRARQLNALFVASRAALPALERANVVPHTVSRALATHTRGVQSAVYVGKRESGAWVFVVVARDAAAAIAALDGLAAMPTAMPGIWPARH